MADQSQGQPFRVLGIALLVEERGEGARLVFRYPIVPQESECDDADNLFFTLSPRTMAKLFRPKKPLCGQPMTISVGGTVFCLRSLLTDQEHSNNSSGSVIVALVPSIHTSAIPISGWYEGGHCQIGREPQAQLNKEVKASASFLAVRKVHVSLARLCRALDREERRCRYVSSQCSQLRKIESDFKSISERHEAASLNRTHISASAEAGKRRSRRAPASGYGSSVVNEMSIDKDLKASWTVPTNGDHQHDQDVMDLILSIQSDATQIHGNLARELLQVYYALSRKHQSFAPTVLSARDSTVFVNRHVAVPIESIAQVHDHSAKMHVRPYHTLLFPEVSASELASCYTSNKRIQVFLSVHDPRKSVADMSHEAALPLDSVLEMATYLVTNHVCIVSHSLRCDSTLVLCEDSLRQISGHSLQFARAYDELSIHSVVALFTNGQTFDELVEYICSGVALPVGLQSTVLQALIDDVARAREDDKRTAIDKAREESENQSGVPQDVPYFEGGRPEHPSVQNEVQRGHDDAEKRLVAASAAFEDYVVAIVAWLGAHNILMSKEQYLISGNYSSGGATAGGSGDYQILAGSLQRDSVSVKGLSENSGTTDLFRFEETLFRDLNSEGCLNGSISIIAICWRYGLDERTINRLTSWGLQFGKLRCIERIPSPSDDWNMAI